MSKEETAKQTQNSFKEKWHNNPGVAFKNTLDENSDIFKWIIKRNGFQTSLDFRNYLSKFNRILDGGCGNGRVTALLRSLSNDVTTEIVGIDFSSWPVAKENLKEYKNIHIEQANLLENLERLGRFDFIYCQEVLHHTGNPYLGFSNLVSLLNPNGEIAIYVYKLKAPIREYTDDFIRDQIAKLPYEEAMKVCNQITDFGKALSMDEQEIDVPQLDILEIPEGKYTMQRLIYHFFMKCFWSNELSYEDNSVINYDWYHPQDCSRHTIEEVRSWFALQNLDIVHECVDFYGITVRGKKK
ncbi:MAG: class I SAM-dependent methyltransferase [Saprospiraceae bacterium]